MSIYFQQILAKKLPFHLKQNKIANRRLGNRGATAILKETTKQDINLDTYFQTLLQANPKIFLEAVEMLRKVTFEGVFTEAGILPEWMEQGRQQGAMKIA